MTPRLALFDDYPHERGHHPDLLVGLAAAAGAAMYCPDEFLEGRVADVRDLHHARTVGSLDGSPDVTRRNLEAAFDDALGRGCDLFVNLFLDENWDSFPIARRGMSVVHALHRPGEMAGDLGGVNATKPGDFRVVFKELAGRRDVVVVHTALGRRQALEWLPEERIVRIGWPSATVAEIESAFSAAPALAEEPYVLLMGEALEYKGILLLLEALDPGPRLKIAGNLAVGNREWVARHYPRADVEWEPGWVTRRRMNQLVDAAAVVVFPYLPGFADHGGVSAALIHALARAKPVIVSDALAAQVPDSPACTVVPAGDVAALRSALTRAIESPGAAHEAIREVKPFMLREHSYEGHVEHLVERALE